MLHKPKLGIGTYVFLIALFCLIFIYTLRLEDYFSASQKNRDRRVVSDEEERPVTKTIPFTQPPHFETFIDDDDEYCPRSTEILRRLRSLMKNNSYVSEPLDAYIVLYQDAHQNDEFIADKDRRLRFLCGFVGDRGTIMVTEEHAYLLTDYENGNGTILDENWTIFIEGDPNVPDFERWFSKVLPEKAKIGFHSFTMPYRQWKKLENEARERKQMLVPVNEDLVDLVWTNRTSAVSDNPLITLELYFTGETVASKIERLRLKMSARGATICLIQSLEEIACLCVLVMGDIGLVNLRGSDIPYVPVFFSYLMVTSTTVHLFADEDKITPAVREHFEKENSSVDFHPYEEVLPIFANIVNSNYEAESKVWLARDTSYAFVNEVAESRLLFEDLPIALMKAIKNEVEIDGFVNAHVKDAAAFCCFFAWLEKELSEGNSNVTELTAAKRLEEYRQKQPNYLGESFPTVSATGAHAAIIHYRVTTETDSTLGTDKIYLCDAGAHYKDGTTDVTRTVHFGEPSDYEKECFTRVLKGHIQLRTSIIPENTRGNVLDAFARKYLWDAGLEYFHGTGHGIGTTLNVHEVPMSVSQWDYSKGSGLQENMLLTNEPGYYENGEFGIRIENILRTIRVKTKYSKRYMKFLAFEDLTLVPIQTSRLLNTAMLTKDEIQYINEYHAKCREKVAPLLQAQGETDGLAWLLKETESIQT